MTMTQVEESLFHQFISEQIEKMTQERQQRHADAKGYVPVVTVSIQPGSGGRMIAEQVAETLGFDFFNREIIHQVAESVKINPEIIEKMEKERLSGVEDLIASFVRDHYLWPGMYLEHLERIVLAIGETGRAVIVGRGANFILDPEKRFSVRIIAPLAVRVQNIVTAYGVSEAEARHRITNRQERRKAFIKKSFNVDVENPLHYDLILNTEAVQIDEAVDAICMFLKKKYKLAHS